MQYSQLQPVFMTRRVFPNAVGRAKGERQSFVGDQLLSYRDASSLVLRRPFDRLELESRRHSPIFLPSLKLLLRLL